MTISGQDRLNTRRSLTVGTDTFDYFSLKAAAEKLGDISRLPFSLKILLENLLRLKMEDLSQFTISKPWSAGKKSDAWRMKLLTGLPAF